mmetsp:Transcript_99404/g.186752  ORF Transcript_99404/g.186752 Transcript_99404/m.186752 type:complete len:101 (-) Transcript_99404:2814-3116(-)
MDRAIQCGRGEAKYSANLCSALLGDVEAVSPVSLVSVTLANVAAASSTTCGGSPGSKACACVVEEGAATGAAMMEVVAAEAECANSAFGGPSLLTFECSE